MNLPFVISSNDHNNILKYVLEYNKENKQLLQFIYFEEEHFYSERQYPFYTALVFKYGFRDENKPITKEEIDRLFWHII